MRHLLTVLTVLSLASVACASDYDLGSQMSTPKTDSHVGTNPGTPDGREGGGETLASPYPDHELAVLRLREHLRQRQRLRLCVFVHHRLTSPDVVYASLPPPTCVNVDLCFSLLRHESVHLPRCRGNADRLQR